MSEPCGPPFWGKYRGTVEKNFDPLGLGRIEVSVPDVLDGTGWAMPCFPGAGPGVGLFAVPPAQAKVWVEFERGDPDYPIYVGGFWTPGDTPAPMGPTQPTTQIWKGANFSMEFNDAPGLGALSLSVTTATGEAVLKADGSSMALEFSGNAVLLDATGVTINKGNLKVLP